MSISQRDSQVVWHPYTQMQLAPSPLAVVRGEGPFLILEDGRRLLDAISSWWVTVHGHAHPHIALAIAKQATQLEQVIFAGFTHQPAVELAERLVAKLPDGLQRVFFTDDGSTAVEVALKMAWQHWQNAGEHRVGILALEGAYHGDTFGAMSLSARSVFTRAFEPLLFEVSHLPQPHTVSSDELIAAAALSHSRRPAAALIVEPLVQGAGGMQMYTAETLDALTRWCRAQGILVIFDEVMTGFYRTGKMFAANHCHNAPDIICLAKGLTGGFLPLSVTACTEAIYNSFLSDDRAKMLFHGHSFTANPLGCAAANASLDLFELQSTTDSVLRITAQHKSAAQKFAKLKGVANVRQCGTIIAMDLAPDKQEGYLDSSGSRVANFMLENGVLIRPLGNVLYLLPPYVIAEDDLELTYELLEKAVEHTAK